MTQMGLRQIFRNCFENPKFPEPKQFTFEALKEVICDKCLPNLEAPVDNDAMMHLFSSVSVHCCMHVCASLNIIYSNICLIIIVFQYHTQFMFCFTLKLLFMLIFLVCVCVFAYRLHSMTTMKRAGNSTTSETTMCVKIRLCMGV